jgi:Zn-dependent protease with chaperone function
VSVLLVNYDGFAFRDGEEEQVLPGRFRFTLINLQFEHASGILELPLSRLILDQNSAGNLVFHDAGTDWWIESADGRILNDNFLLRQTHLRAQARELRERREGNRSLKYALIFLAGFAGFFFIGWLLAKAAANSLANHAPVAWEEHLTDKVIAEHPKLFVTDTNDARITVVTQLVARLAAALPPAERHYQFRAVILDRYIDNAFALPGGRIFVFKGLLDRVQKPEELAGVLAHEMAHVTQRHGLRKLIAGGGPYYILRLFVSDQQGVLSVISAGSQLLVNQYYSRDVEREADTIGWHYLMAANIDPRGLADFFQLQTEGENADTIPEMFRSHPAASERIASLNRLWEKNERKSGFVTLPALPAMTNTPLTSLQERLLRSFKSLPK